MRNLLRFLINYYALFLFLFLEGFCLFLITRNNFYHRSAFINSANAVSGNILNTYEGVSGYFYLKRVNDSLAIDNARLRAKLQSSEFNNKIDVRTSDSRFIEQKYTYIPASVINNSVVRFRNYITLNKGYKHGVRKNMGVLSGNGIAGIVVNVSEHFSVAMSLLHSDVRVSGKLENEEFFGSVTWDGRDPRQASLEDIPKNATPGKGMSVITTGYSTFFPEGIKIGTIDDFYLPEGRNFYRIRINLATSFSSLKRVYVVNYLFEKEQKELEEKIMDDDE